MVDNPVASSDHYYTILVGLLCALRELDGDCVEPDVQVRARRQCMPFFDGKALGSLWCPLADFIPNPTVPREIADCSIHTLVSLYRILWLTILQISDERRNYYLRRRQQCLSGVPLCRMPADGDRIAPYCDKAWSVWTQNSSRSFWYQKHLHRFVLYFVRDMASKQRRGRENKEAVHWHQVEQTSRGWKTAADLEKAIRRQPAQLSKRRRL